VAERSLGRRVGNLILALLNATLIIAALCLWLAWNAFSAAERVAVQVEEAAQTVLPLRAEIVALTEEVAAMRGDLAELRADGAADLAALEARIASAEADLARLRDAVAQLAADPEALVDRAVASAFDGLGETVADILDGLRGEPAAPDS
jgi:cell division protein FtsB